MEKYEELHFDLRSVVTRAAASANVGVGVGNPTDAPAGGSGIQFFSTFNFGVLFTASLWDAYYRLLRFLKFLAFVDFLDSLDVLLRMILLMLSVVQVVDFWIMNTPESTELEIMGYSFYAIACLSVVFHLLERLVGRYVRDAPTEGGKPEDQLPLQLVNRAKFANVFNAAVITLAYIAMATALLLSVLTHLMKLEDGLDNVSLGFIIYYLVCEVVHAFARMPRFRDIAQQSATAAHLAGTQTLLTLCVSLPFGVMFCVHASRQDM